MPCSSGCSTCRRPSGRLARVAALVQPEWERLLEEEPELEALLAPDLRPSADADLSRRT